MDKLMSSRLFGEFLRSEEPGFKKRIDYLEWYEKLRNNFDDFLNQQLAIWMFVPCKLADNVWVVLEEPVNYSAFECGMSAKDFNFNVTDCLEFKESKERVLFEGFEYDNPTGQLINKDNVCIYFSEISFKLYLSKYKIIKIESVEDLINNNLKLTPTAKKQIGL